MVYILQKDTPNKKAGTKFIYAPCTGGFYYAENDGNCGFHADHVENNKEWFLPYTATLCSAGIAERKFIEYLSARFNINKEDAYTIGQFVSQIEKEFVPSEETLLNLFRDFFSFHNPTNKGWKGIDEQFYNWYEHAKNQINHQQ